MTLHPAVRLSGVDEQMHAGLESIRDELHIPRGFPADVVAEAVSAAQRRPSGALADLTDIEFVTVDPVGSMDLDQAVHIERRGSGFRVRYAIADVPSFVRPGGRLDDETHARGETYYLPDAVEPLHPRELSEGAASLLPNVERPAQVWVLDLSSDGGLERVEVHKALVRSRAKLDYPGVQRQLDDDAAPELLLLLRQVGRLRQQQAIDRGAVTLNLSEQIIERDPGGSWQLTLRAPLPVEAWNAEISLLTGMAAAGLMIDGKVGVLRTLPEPSEGVVASYRRSALALGVPWPPGWNYGTFVSGLDAKDPVHAALARMATMLVRGAGYVAFDGSLPEHVEHSAVAGPYAHVTAPLRRLVDRYAGATCLALCAGDDVPGWVRDALVRLPEEMAAADHRAHAVDRAVIDLAEAVLLQSRLGERFDATVVEVQPDRVEVQLRDPAVRARCDGNGLELGQRVSVRLAVADPTRREVRFAPA